MLAADDLHLLYPADTRGVNNGNLETVAWSQDGQSLYAGGRYYDGSTIPLFSWSQIGRGAYHSKALTSSSTIMDIQSLDDGRLVYGAADPMWGVLTNDGHKQLEKTALIVDYRDSELRLNNNASVLGFSHKGQSQVFDLPTQTYNKTTTALSPAKTTAKDFDISDWYDTFTPKFNQQPLKLQPNDMSRSLAISSDEQHFLLGTEWSLRYYDKQAHEQWRIATPSVAWAVNLSNDGRFAVAAFADGTIRTDLITPGVYGDVAIDVAVLSQVFVDESYFFTLGIAVLSE